MTRGGDLKRELETLRRELGQVPRVVEEEVAAVANDVAAAAQSGDTRSEVERILHELQERLEEAADDAEDIVAAHPFASVAAAFLLGALVAGLIARAR